MAFSMCLQSSAEYIINPSTMVNLIHGEDIRMGGIVKGLGEIANYYIPRTINRRIFVNIYT